MLLMCRQARTKETTDRGGHLLLGGPRCPWLDMWCRAITAVKDDHACKQRMSFF